MSGRPPYRGWGGKRNSREKCSFILNILGIIALIFIFIAIILLHESFPGTIDYIKIYSVKFSFIELITGLKLSMLILTRETLGFFVSTRVFTIESSNSKVLFIIAMLLHALFVYIFIFFSIYTIFMSTDTVMFTYLTIAYEIVSEAFWWFIDNYILAPCPYLEDSGDELVNNYFINEQKLIEDCQNKNLK